MYLNQIFELSMVLDKEKFQKALTTVYDNSEYLEKNGDEYIDTSLSSKGVTIVYRNSQYKKKIKFIINSVLLLNYEEIKPKKIIKKLNKYISEYFDSTYILDDFNLVKVTFIADINIGDNEKISAYIKVLQRIGKVKGFSPSDYECFDKNSSFCLDGNSNGIEFLIYDLKEMLINQLKEREISYKKQKSVIKKSDGVLRAEVRLTEQKAIRSYTDNTDTSKQIMTSSEKNWDIFLNIFTQIIPFGDFYKKDKAIEIIQKEITDITIRRRMLRLVTLIPEKKSLLLAQKALNYRRIDDVMEAFAKINLSPVTISRRYDVKHLKNIYSYLFDEKS